ncbi:MAG: hypothetical protein KF835_16035 [Xanthobacteraceae bacterium]|nr:hypothetical protein [Xanthobacteraceae bacterium]
MKRPGSYILRSWRRPFGWLASYVLVLQLVLGAFAGAQFTAHATGQNWSFFEICFGQSVPAGELPQGKADKKASKAFGCAACANAATAVAPELPEIAVADFTIRHIDWNVSADRTAHSDLFFFQRQRAPPIAA